MFSVKGKRVLVTGQHGFLGKHLCRWLDYCGAIVPEYDRKKYDLTDGLATRTLVYKTNPEYIIHAAGYNGGISFNTQYPADIYHRNVMMGLNIVHAAKHWKIPKVLSLITSCAYGGFSVCPEHLLFAEPPHPSVDCHAYAKRALQTASEMFNRQYGLNAVCVCLPTVYGPGDRTDPDRTKFVTALVKKFVDAKRNGEERVVLWGTGQPLRQLVYVEDAAVAIVKALEQYDESILPLNVAFDSGLAIIEVAEIIADFVGFQGDIVCDISRPDGQFKKELDFSRMNEMIDFHNFEPTPVLTGIKKTVEWYEKSLAS